MFVAYIKRACETSSIKCLPKLMRSRTVIQKCLWSVSLVIGLGVASYEVYGLLSAYISHQTSLSVSTQQGILIMMLLKYQYISVYSHIGQYSIFVNKRQH